ncbi:helix-turn-helix domain-containing protein [Intestinibacter sp.]|uniref:helix-turn-helix domain-containing protein n=1 Tax=Intestinibacter sp. TaxID=1965304 RepID=UPI002A7542D3|nr:helix-turn-helix transcriptional regulator [Intestinibacter sp.]MDY2734712.1 helix-turn-helix transcriptional regulator [Intestinibacter sp.]
MADIGIFSKRLRTEREKLGLKQKEMAEKLNMPSNTYNGYETGKRIPALDVASNIADALNVTTDYLLGREEKTQQSTLNQKDEKDIAKNMSTILDQLQNQQSALMFNGEVLDDETRELLASSLENSLRMGKIIAKEKYTPKKYRK